MTGFHISERELATARTFFADSDVGVLAAQCSKINQAQPNIPGMAYDWEMNGLDPLKVDDMLESVFVVYYAQTEVRKKALAEISFEDIQRNTVWFGEFLSYYNSEREGGSENLLSVEFLRDEVVLQYAVRTLRRLFPDTANIPEELVFSYFSLLKAIEVGVEAN